MLHGSMHRWLRTAFNIDTRPSDGPADVRLALDSTGEPAGWPARLMPYVVIDTVVSLRSVSAGVARAGLPYFTAWPQTVGERPHWQRGVHLHNSGRGGSVT